MRALSGIVDGARDRALGGARVLITGGVGFIGSRLALRLVGDGAQVTVLDASLPESGANDFNLMAVADRLTIIRGDVRDVSVLRQSVRDQAVLFNMAGLTSHVDSLRAPHDDLDVNYRAQLGIVDACLAVNPAIRIVHASTRQVYGVPDGLPVAESHPVRPPDPNGINKYAAELWYQLNARLHGLRVTSLRLTNTYGPHMRVRDARQTFLGLWIARAVADEQFEVWGGEQVRDFTFVDDVVDACCRVASLDDCGGVFNVGGPASSLRELANLITQVAGSGSYVVKQYDDDRRAIDIGSYVADDGALRKATGWSPRTSLREGIERTVEFYRENVARYV